MTQFKTGWKGKTRDGHDAEVIKDDLKDKAEPRLVVVCTERNGTQWVSTVYANGRYNNGQIDSPHDLINQPEYLEGWVNVYSGGSGGVIYKTKEAADSIAGLNNARHSCVHIRVPYRRGDGL